MTKDELNKVLKINGLALDKQFDGTNENYFIIRAIFMDNVRAIAFDEHKFYSQGVFRFEHKVLKALVDYAETPIEERKPKPQLYNIIIAKDIQHGSPYLTAWRKANKLGQYFITDAAEQRDLLHSNDFKFTIEEIEDLKSKVSEKQKQIIDIGMEKVEDTMSAGVDIDEVEDD